MPDFTTGIEEVVGELGLQGINHPPRETPTDEADDGFKGLNIGESPTGLGVDMVKQYGEDSIFVKIAAVMFGSTETTFYVIAVYFGAVNIKNTRHALHAGLTADIAAMLIASWVVLWMFG